MMPVRQHLIFIMLHTTGWGVRHVVQSLGRSAMSQRQRIARNLAAALLAGVWTQGGLQARSVEVLGQQTRTLQRRLLRDLLGSCPSRYPPSSDWIVDFVLHHHWFDAAIAIDKPGGSAPTVLDTPTTS